MDATHTLTTALQPGAVAILHVHGSETHRVLEQLTGHAAWPVGRLRLSRFADIDEGLAGLIRPDTAQLMPHAGPRVVQKLQAWLDNHHVPPATHPVPQALYPEADSPLEADVLHAIANAASPAAVDLLAAQPKLWRIWHNTHPRPRVSDPGRSPLRHLLIPPTVVVVGRPNVGKSTLLNQLLGRAASVVADLPGTTRDWVGGLVELAPAPATPLTSAVAVRWLDTPGLRHSDDPVEQRAIALARRLTEQADVLIAMRDPERDWPEPEAFPRHRTPDLWLRNKSRPKDTDAPGSREHPLHLTAREGDGIEQLQQRVLQTLGLSPQPPAEPALWAFSPRLQDIVNGRSTGAEPYLGVEPKRG
ncbi:MAG: GTPase [Planctomycetota bacterium]